MRRKKREPFPEGTRVRVLSDPDHGPGPWPAQPTGRVVSPPEMVRGVRRPLPTYWVEFDEPQLDVEGDGPYERSQVLGKYLALVDGTPDDGLKRFRSPGQVVVISGDTQMLTPVPIEAVEALPDDERLVLRTTGEPGWFGPEPVRDDLRRILDEVAVEAHRIAVEAALSEAEYACRYGTGMAVVPPGA